jgi:hypothetical protein
MARQYTKAPVDNCLECPLYDECEKYSSGKCLLWGKKPESTTSHTQRWKTYWYDKKDYRAIEWAKYLGLSYTVVYGRLKKYGAKAIPTYFSAEYAEAKKREKKRK